MASFEPELAYSFRRARPVMPATGDDAAAWAVLAVVEDLLIRAAARYNAREYLAAIDSYLEARRLLLAQLFPTVQIDKVKVPDLELTNPFISYAAEWLNVLPIEQPLRGVRPRQDVPDVKDDALGLRSGKLDDAGIRAAADLDVAVTLDSRGNLAAGRFFRDRATRLAPDLVPLLETPAVAPAGPALALRAPAPAAAIRDESTALPIVRVPPAITVDDRVYRVKIGETVVDISWAAGDAPAVGELVKTMYARRVGLGTLPDSLIAPQRPADAAAAIAHVYAYETPLGLAECYHALGDWTTAEQWYVTASQYQFLNVPNEVPYLWARLAALYLDWGNALYRLEQPADALPIYERVLTSDLAAPTSGTLYASARLGPAADVARTLIADLTDLTALAAHPTIAAVLLDVRAQLEKIAGGLDFWGHWTGNVPIWTFDYLQSVALNFCQLAVSAERDAMAYWEKADLGQLTRTQLVQTVSQANAEADAAHRQADAAAAEVAAYQAGEQTTQRRAQDARANAQEYLQKSTEWTLHQALSAELNGGDNEDPGTLTLLADMMINGVDPRNYPGRVGTVAAGEQLASTRLQRDYEVDSMLRQATELEAASTQATAERVAAEARATAAQASALAADVRATSAGQLVAAFDAQRFTPDVWNQLGQRLSALSQRYLAMALDVAKRMQRAYNFENDVSLAIIKADYGGQAVNGFLAADALTADVQAFSYDLVTSTAPKAQPIRQTISLADRYPFLFESQFRRTGRMEFQTRIEDFDAAYPGTYAGRIEHVEVEVDGIVPPRGISGVLTNAGISHYRVPARLKAHTPNGLKHRVQNAETAVLSDYDLRSDALVVTEDRRRLRVFEGAGVASSWTLDLPPAINELDYGAVTDVRLTFTYQARFDPDLRTAVLDELAALPALNERQRPVPLRWLFPDAFFRFYGSGVLAFTLTQGFFPLPQRDPRLTGLSLVVATTPAGRASGIALDVSAPGQPAVPVTTAADGTVPAAALAAAAGGSALGEYRLVLGASANPGWVSDGVLALDAIANVAVVLGYSFTPRA